MSPEKPTILIVDDEPLNIEVLADLLEGSYQLIAARGGEQALKRALAEPSPDLILLDIMMPGMDGYEVCRRLKADAATADIPVIFVTALNASGDEAKGLDTGAVDFIRKPFSPPTVLARVRTHLSLKQAREEAEAANRAKSVFLATMSHEIRTPMYGVLGMLDVLGETQMGPAEAGMVNTARNSANLLLNIINDILDFSRIEAGKLDLEHVSVSLQNVVEEVGDILQPLAAEKGLVFKTFIDPEIPDSVLGDSLRTRQILFNLGGNAIKFTESKSATPGQVMIRVEQTEDRTKGWTRVRFSVEDNGIGMSKDMAERIFKPFSQAETSTTRRFGGTGLGLSIVKSLTDLMGGEIAVNSTPGIGTTFIVTVSFQSDDAHPSPRAEPDLDGVRVLAAVPDKEDRNIISRYLESRRCQLQLVAWSEELLRAATRAFKSGHPFDACIVDLPWDGGGNGRTIVELSEAPGLESQHFVFLVGERIATREVELANIVFVENFPLRRSTFIQGVARAAGRFRDSEDGPSPSARINVPSIEEAKKQGQLILVAEDNATNRTVIGRQLNMLGYACEMATDGEQALDLWQSGDYALLLTDLHMPKMDGYQLAAAIREMETGKDTAIPVIAITAETRGDRPGRCLEAGMNDVIAKPLEMSKLRTVLEKWAPGPLAPHDNTPLFPASAHEPDVGSSINPRVLKEMFGDDDAIFKEILDDFMASSQDILKELEEAYIDHRARDVAAAAHKLESSSRSVGAIDVADCCADLEAAGKSEDWTGVEDHVPHIIALMSAAEEYVNKL